MHIYTRILKNSLMLIALFSTILVAQSKITTELLSVRDGLSSNSIRDIIQDQYGYMWISTRDGVNIYDGYQIKILKSIENDTTSLPSNNIYRILEDRKGTIWISSEGGISKYNRKTGTFKNYVPPGIGDNSDPTSIILYEDSQNKLWVSTEEQGVLEFDRDSEKFIRYDIINPDNSVATYVNFGGTICENDQGELYVVSQSWGLLKFDYNTSLFLVVPLQNNFNDYISGNVAQIDLLFDNENNLWLANTTGLVKIDMDTKTGYDLTPFEKRKIIQNYFVDNSASGLFLHNDNLWVGTGRHGLYIYNLQKKTFEKILSSNSFFYNAFFKDKSGILWFASTRGVLRHDFNRKPFELYHLPGDDTEENENRLVNAYYESFMYPNHLWMATSHGLMLFDAENETIINADKKYKKLALFQNQAINSISEDENGTLWLSTSAKGFFSVNLKSGVIKNYTKTEYDNSTLQSDIVHSHLKINNTIWLATHQGLNVLKENDSKVTLIPSFLNRTYDNRIMSFIKQHRENSDPVSSIIKVGDYADISKEFVLRNDRKLIIYAVGEGLPAWNMVDYGWLESIEGDTLWTSKEVYETFHVGGGDKNRIKISLLDLKAGRYKLRYKSDDSHSYESYNTIAPPDTSYWGTQIFALNENEFTQMNTLLSFSNSKPFLNNEDIQVLYGDSKHNIWVGTMEGLAKIDTTFDIKNYLRDVSDPNSISDNRIRDIREDLKGDIWIATSNGLNKYNAAANNFSKITEKDGLPSSNLAAIEIDDNGHLWVSGIKGISKIELEDRLKDPVIVNYDVKDGLQGYEFMPNASFKDKTGKLYFAGHDGFNAFYPGSSNRTPPFLTIQDIKISNKSIKVMEDFDLPDLNHPADISLSHDQNDLSFEFASIHYSRPDKNRLMYKMDGADEDWILGNRRFASYTNLRPGDYTFNIKGSNGDGIWSDEVKQIQIHIAAPWYNNWAAYSIYILLFFGLLFGVRSVEMGRQQKNAKIKESQLRAEAAELKAKAAEAQALVVQAENERKSKELEEARALQLSMLPKELPQLPNLDIAVYMQTATEVGGDYYDFHVGLDGTLTVVIGDATGHGMRAGTMVTTAKSLFNSYAPNPDILYSFQEITRCIKQMNFGKLSMCMTMLKIKGDKMQISTAGMPPSFIFRRDTRVIEEHLFKAMPLGSMDNFPYELKDTTLKPGDTILLMSDGLPELKNDNGKMYGYKKVRNSFEDVAEKSPEEIITFLKNEGSSWVNDEAPDDDVTFVVIKVK